jgi:hypothetical protein
VIRAAANGQPLRPGSRVLVPSGAMVIVLDVRRGRSHLAGSLTWVAGA